MAKHPRLTLAVIVALALVLRLAWVAWIDYQPTLSDDAGRYDFLARSLANGGGFINPNGNVTLFWPPGYPFFVAVIYRLWPSALFGNHEVSAALVANAIIGAATCGLVYALAGRLVRSQTRRDSQVSGLVAAAMYALLPSAIFYGGVTLTETWFTFLLTLSLYLLVLAEERRSRAMLIAAGIVIGYASLVRGQALLLPIVAIPFWLAVARNRLSSTVESGTAGMTASGGYQSLLFRVGLTAAIAGAIVLPWAIRNYAHAGRPVAIATNSGVDFYIGHSPEADGRGRIVDELVFRYPELPPAEAEARVSSDGFREGIKYAVRHPTREAVLSVKKVWYLYADDHEALAWSDAHGERYVMPQRTRDALAILSDVYYAAIMLLAAAGIALWLWHRQWRTDPTGVLLLSVVAYWTLVHVGFFGDPRFHAPIMPLMCVWAGVTVGRVLALPRRDR